jgi:hypothetical protein
MSVCVGSAWKILLVTARSPEITHLNTLNMAFLTVSVFGHLEFACIVGGVHQFWDLDFTQGASHDPGSGIFLAHDFQDMDGEPSDFTVSKGHGHPLVLSNITKLSIIKTLVLQVSYDFKKVLLNLLFLHLVRCSELIFSPRKSTYNNYMRGNFAFQTIIY